jgi:acyl-CoA synthetase (AMP-forming)/AMP-acid ligase II
MPTDGAGVKRPGDRVATLAWNSQAHVEAWYAIMGMGAVCHTLNPRLTGAQLAAMVEQSGARILIASADLMPLASQIAERPTIERVLVIDGPAHSKAGAARVLALEPLIAEAGTDIVWGEFDETAPCGLCFTSGTTGAPKGVTYTHRSSFLHTLRLLQADVMALTAGRVAGRWCRCSTPMPGACPSPPRRPARSWCCPAATPTAPAWRG